MISETQKIAGVFQTSFYSYDGHGSVRQLTNTAGTGTDTYTYDAFGNLIEQTGTTPGGPGTDGTFLYDSRKQRKKIAAG